VITIDRINNQETLDDVLESYEEMLTENDDEDELTNALSDILKIKLNYPAGNYEAIYDAAKDIKVKAKNPDLAFKAAMLLRLLRADVSAELIARLNAMDLAEVWDTIAAEVY
jgi:oligoribonuclease NrnB/cAMP/cGMP phosphodiesterase (DHH superfamily)